MDFWESLFFWWQGYYPRFDDLWNAFFAGGSRFLLVIVVVFLQMIGLGGWVGPVDVWV